MKLSVVRRSRSASNKTPARERADGPTGVHVIDESGNVLALISRDDDSTDILLTGAGAPRLETLAFGVTLSLELLRPGHPHRV